ncbi:head GIN domain-containing protein [Seonamhaeicola marinus]|uniref:DUF2807 domain-containing protein n=1 Tax=Seonamhaeicola marinus TaxID=1912246 RepID=A0A5D0HXI6_9FLAO|nr:head GIN domain-containing protein [Seonamhaeicola marinus]TYA74162.1 DUF2807 domain-containing protein [Seonamhaeicola marinus]
MKTIHIFYLLGALVLLLSSCSIDLIKASSDITSEERVVTSFNAVKASNDIEVVIKKGNTHTVEVTTSHNLQEHVKTSVKNGVLYLELDKIVRKLKELRVDITMPEISKITLSSDAFGNVTGFENMDSFNVTVSSDAFLLLSGSSNNMNIKASSDARIEAFDFKTQNCNVACSSDASVSITCLNALNGSVSSDGSLYYKGTPSINVQTNSDGVLINAN